MMMTLYIRVGVGYADGHGDDDDEKCTCVANGPIIFIVYLL